MPHALVPVTFYGTFATNLSARNSLIAPTVDREANAWTAGVFVGDPVALVRIGFAYYYVEANAFPSMFLESDVLDGTPNREGYMLSLQRQLFENVDLGARGASCPTGSKAGTAFADSGPGVGPLPRPGRPDVQVLIAAQGARSFTVTSRDRAMAVMGPA